MTQERVVNLQEYERIAGGDTAETWDPEQMPILEGKVTFKGYYQVTEHSTGGVKDVPSLIVEDKETGHPFSVTIGYKLRSFFDKVDEGQSVLIQYKGSMDVGQPSKMKVYEAFVKKA